MPAAPSQPSHPVMTGRVHSNSADRNVESPGDGGPRRPEGPEGPDAAQVPSDPLEHAHEQLGRAGRCSPACQPGACSSCDMRSAHDAQDTSSQDRGPSNLTDQHPAPAEDVSTPRATLSPIEASSASVSQQGEEELSFSGPVPPGSSSGNDQLPINSPEYSASFGEQNPGPLQGFSSGDFSQSDVSPEDDPSPRGQREEPLLVGDTRDSNHARIDQGMMSNAGMITLAGILYEEWLATLTSDPLFLSPASEASSLSQSERRRYHEAG